MQGGSKISVAGVTSFGKHQMEVMDWTRSEGTNIVMVPDVRRIETEETLFKNRYAKQVWITADLQKCIVGMADPYDLAEHRGAAVMAERPSRALQADSVPHRPSLWCSGIRVGQRSTTSGRECSSAPPQKENI